MGQWKDQNRFCHKRQLRALGCHILTLALPTLVGRVILSEPLLLSEPQFYFLERIFSLTMQCWFLLLFNAEIFK